MNKIALGAGGAVVAGALWWRRHPSACPYGQRVWVEAPHPFVTRERLYEALAPQPGERILEVGPGTGYYSLGVAERVGALELLDVQREFLDHTTRRAREAGLANVVATQADARSMPFEDGRFDGAYLTAVLGEVPDQDAALRERARVGLPGGRGVVGELLGDPHWVAPRTLRRRAEAAGLTFARRVGPWFGCFSVLRRDA